MEGPRILARSLGHSVERGDGEAWQYNGRSNLHARQVSWAIFFDLIATCDVFAAHVARGAVGFVLDYQLQSRLQRRVHFAICRVGNPDGLASARTFAQLGRDIGIVLTPDQEAILGALPVFREEARDDAGELLVAVEAKACMTDHSGAIPRLFSEMLAGGYLAKQAVPDAITVAHTLVNASASFVSSSNAKPKKHPSSGPEAVVRMIKEAIPTAQEARNIGFDAVGVTVVNCVNDGSPVELVTTAPAPRRSDPHHYDWMISNLCSTYTAKFSRLAD